MRRYIFNEEYFKNSFWHNLTISKKYDKLANFFDVKADTIESYRKNKRTISQKGYCEITDKVDKYLFLDTEKLLSKFVAEANRDLSANEKYVAFIMLCSYEKRGISGKWVTIEELSQENEFIIKKVHKILKNTTIKINGNGDTEKLFLCNKNEQFTINISACIKYSNI